MSLRVQSSLIKFRREAQANPLREAQRLHMGRVIETYPEHGVVDIALERGPVLRGVPALADGVAGTNNSTNAMPQVWNGPKAKLLKDGSIYDESKPDPTRRETRALVGFIDGYHNKPMVLGYIQPNFSQMSMPDPNMELKRHATDIHEVYWSDDGIDLRPPPFGAGDGKNDLLNGNYQLIFPDRQKDFAVSYSGAGRKATKSVAPPVFGNDHQTYVSVGTHDLPRVFGKGKESANFDHEDHPWTLSPQQLGDEKKARDMARGIWLNQRWRSRLGINPLGNVTLRAEGRCFDSTDFKDEEVIEGRLDLWSRLETRRWQKHEGTWTRMRPRHDGMDPESVKTAKKTGSQTARVQRLWDVAVRKDAEFRVKDTFKLHVGDFDSKWDDGDNGADPGKAWDATVLNPDFKHDVGDDIKWKGDDYQDAANVDFHFKRWEKAKEKGPQKFTWKLDPQKRDVDVLWSLDLEPYQGRVDMTTTLTPSEENDALYSVAVSGHYALNLALDSSNGAADLTTQASNGVSANVTLNAQLEAAAVNIVGLHHTLTVLLDAHAGLLTLRTGSGDIPTCSVTLNDNTGEVAVTGGTFTFNGAEVLTA